MFIYKITNLINGKIYIGQTTRSVYERWKDHKFHKGCTALYRAIKKYEHINFKIEEICFCFDKEELNLREQYFIKQYDCLVPNGYNICVGGNSPMKNRKHTSITKQNISEKMKLKDFSYLNTKENIEKRIISFKKNNKLKNIPRTTEIKRKISVANSGENHGMYGKLGFACPNFKCAILCVELNKIFGGQAEAARELNLHQANIHKVLTGRRPHTGGYTFKYVKEETHVHT